ncbi:MAG: extracellular solute-binding protein family 1 [Lachnospiraceae bacterium]|nr:extracellular solute-binding protein family 1 [Lachnospiraceae bacterium]
MKKLISICLVLCMVLSLAACSNTEKDAAKTGTTETTDTKDTEETAEPTEAAATETTGDLVIYCPHPLEFINPLVSEFESQTGIKVEVIAAGTGELLKRVESEQANPLGDIFWGGSLSTMKPQMEIKG